MAGSSGVLAVRVLGPMEVSVDGRPVGLTTGRLRTVLAVLAVAAGDPVSVDRLSAALWGEDQPGNARRGVQTYLTRLRAAVGADAIGAGPAGYTLHVEPDQVDAVRFVRLLDLAVRTPDPAAERALLDQALALWRGSPFDGVASTWLEHSEAPRLQERFLAAVERRTDLDLGQDPPGELVAQLRELTAQHPLRETLWARLLLVLGRSGRQAEALERYETIRSHLADELGSDPGPMLQQIYTDLLAGRAPQVGADPAPVAPARPVVPRQLPTDIIGFAGRAAALKALHALLPVGRAATAGAVVISAIAGTAGVGKTALAVHWAHQVADHFPDGQLYVNLRGFHPSGRILEPAEAIRGFLDALGAPPQRIPAGLAAQAGLYRSTLAGRRVLVLLDNARDADQVRPLLPGSPGCLVVVTSRNQLTGLVATETAQPLLLDLLDPDEARELLAGRLGPDRVGAEPDAVAEIIDRCARLPLALAVTAARAAAHPGFPLRVLAAQLREAQTGLDGFAADDPVTDARAVFSWSYQILGAPAATLFRQLGRHSGPDISVPAAASLGALPVPQARRLLAELARAHLVSEHAPGRYTFHDLLRAYAAELAHGEDADHDRRAAWHRLLDHYLHTAAAAAPLILPHWRPLALEPPLPGVRPERPADHEQALAWCAAEHTVLLAAIDRAVRAGFDRHAWQLGWALSGYFYRRGYWHDWAATQRTALAAALRLGDRRGQARTHANLAGAYTYLDRPQDAHTHLQEALDLYRELGDPGGQARVHLNLALVCENQDRYADGFHHAQQALDLYLATDDQTDRSRALNAVGWYHALLGRPQQALRHCQQALAIQREHGDRHGQANTLDSLGYVYRQLGRHRPAADCYRQALELFRADGDRYHEATTLARLGDMQLAAGEPDAARTTWREALAILDELGNWEAGKVRAKLQNLTSPA